MGYSICLQPSFSKKGSSASGIRDDCLLRDEKKTRKQSHLAASVVKVMRKLLFAKRLLPAVGKSNEKIALGAAQTKFFSPVSSSTPLFSLRPHSRVKGRDLHSFTVTEKERKTGTAFGPCDVDF
ncbi:hypothetical protein NPIL_74341 [Nephila pilipes]|uniref:Uncharacterized protein n=1 Tax=Nephila pilipes TaxID=299642 RepID=A0A8X6U6R0_NEPPI|nr:hypothetical protein NPIL_74341 [Nephila pilipes]